MASGVTPICLQALVSGTKSDLKFSPAPSSQRAFTICRIKAQAMSVAPLGARLRVEGVAVSPWHVVGTQWGSLPGPLPSLDPGQGFEWGGACLPGRKLWKGAGWGGKEVSNHFPPPPGGGMGYLWRFAVHVTRCDRKARATLPLTPRSQALYS